MRLLLALSFGLLTTASVVAQPQPKPTSIEVGEVGKPDRASMELREEVYVGRGGIELTSRPLAPASRLIASGFRIRAWKEGDSARVMIHAVMTDDRAPNRRTETPISTFKLALGESREVTETDDWGAARLVITAIIPPSRR